MDDVDAGRITDLLRRLWIEVLKVPDVRDDSNFFGLGGHSMLAARLVSRCEQDLAVSLPFSLPFEHPTFADFARQVGELVRAGSPATAPGPGPSGRSGGPLALQQEQLMLLEHALGPSPVNNATTVVLLPDDVPTDVLGDAVAGLVRRHPALRSAIRPGPDGDEQVVLTAGGVHLEVAGAADDEQARRVVRRGHLTPFDLSTGRMLRGQVIRRRDAGDLLVLHVHHAACDGASLGVLLDDLATGAATLPHVAGRAGYLDYALWQRERSAELLVAARPHWRRVVRRLVADRIRHGTPVPATAGRPPRVARTATHHPASLLAQIGTWATVDGCTPFAVVTAAAAAAFARLSGRRHVGVGTLLDNRREAALEGVVGAFATSTLLGIAVPAAVTSRELAHAVRDAVVAAGRSGHQPLELLLAGPATDLGVPPSALVDLVVTLDVAWVPPADAALPIVPVDDGERPLVPAVADLRTSLAGRLSAEGDLTMVAEHPDTPEDRGRALALQEDFTRLLRHFADAPDTPITAVDRGAAREAAGRTST